MKRLTTDSPDGNFETMLNFVYGKDGWAYIRHDGEHENVLLTDWAKRQCQARGCEEVTEDSPEEIDQRLCDCMMDDPICPIAMAYCFASQACHMRSRLKMYEDNGLTPEEIYQQRFIIAAHKDPEKLSRLRELVDADVDGRLVVLPCKVGDKVLIDERTLPYHYLHPADGCRDYAKCEIVSIVTVKKETYMKLRALYPSRANRREYLRYGVTAIGKTVFLTRAEAEAALKEREEVKSHGSN